MASGLVIDLCPYAGCGPVASVLIVKEVVAIKFEWGQ